MKVKRVKVKRGEGEEGVKVKTVKGSESPRSGIKLVQLPVPEVHHLYSDGNIPLAAGYLKAFALKKGAVEDHEMEIIPGDRANNGGDTAILKWALQDNTAIVGFTSYMWNIDRNLYLARKIKEANPDITILFGGPEMADHQPLLKNNAVDSIVIGEGELAFVDFLKDFKKGNGVKRLYQCTPPVDLTGVPNPYLENILIPRPGESLLLETMRGCPYHCKYCFYSKSYSGLRFFPKKDLPELFNLAQEKGVGEIYFMDPSFNITPAAGTTVVTGEKLKEKLEIIGGLNTTGIPIHTEIRLEAVTPEIAELMGQAGFKSVEAGLQSTNEKSLTAVNRSWNMERFTRGAELLHQQDIDVKTGVILGLPLDTPEDFLRTLDFVMGLNLEESMEIYPLSLLPGTRLRDEAEKLGIAYMSHPPYWVSSTRCMGEQDIKNTIEMIEHKLDIEFFPPVIPRFVNVHPIYLHCLDLREKTDSRLDALYRNPEQVGHSLTVLVDEKIDIKRIKELGGWLRQVSPSTLVQLVLDRESIPPEKEIREISGAFYFPGHYFNHIHHYKIDRQRTYSLRFFHLTGRLEIAESYLYRSMYCDLVLRYSPGLLEKGRDILEEKPILLVDSPIREVEIAEIKRIYEGFENFTAFITDGQRPL